MAGTGPRQAALLSERLTKLDSTVVVRAVRVPSSGEADEREGIRGTGVWWGGFIPTLSPKPHLAPYWSGLAAQSW